MSLRRVVLPIWATSTKADRNRGTTGTIALTLGAPDRAFDVDSLNGFALVVDVDEKGVARAVRIE